MKRSALQIGAVVGLHNKYTIDEVIGLGANCIVYDAHSLDDLRNKKAVKLKECYPAIASVTRKENALFWKEDSDKESAYARFDKAYQISSRCRIPILQEARSSILLTFSNSTTPSMLQ
jgi:hypothetical protein